MDFNYLKEDIKKYYLIDHGTDRPSLKDTLKLWLFNWGFHCVLVYRLGCFSKELYRKHRFLGIVPLNLFRVLNILVSLVHHVEILAKIGPGFYIGHAGNIYIGPTEIGSNFSINNNVTIGYGLASKRKGVPKVGNSVWVGTGSILFGNIEIGSGVTIMPGTILSKSIPDNCLAGGNPGRIIKTSFDNRDVFNGYSFNDKLYSSK